MLVSLVSVLGSSMLAAQDMVAVSWSGGVYAIDSYAGTQTYLGMGLMGQNALARDSQGVLWSTERAGTQYSLTTVDPVAGTATVAWPFVDVRGLANAGGGMLYGVQQGGADTLVLIDPSTGQSTVIGSIGFTGVQALTFMNGVLYGWDVNFELLLIDPVTGAGIDVSPVSLGIGSGVQWLAQRGDGKLVGGNNALYEIDVTTGTATTIGTGFTDLRGAEPWQQSIHNFGSGCYQVSSTAMINAGPNPRLSVRSLNHDANSLGLVIFGVSSTSTGGLPLPVSIDPIFGTTGCTLYVSLDVTVGSVTSSATPATLDVQIPILSSWRGQSLMVQHAVLENVPGGVSLSA